MFVIYTITVVTTLGFCLFGIRQFYSYSWESPANEALRRLLSILSVTFTIAYVIIVMALILLTFVLMCERFYKSMYSEQGYLTHTLPVNPLSNLNARLITSIIWLFISGILLILSILAISISLDPQDFFGNLRFFSYTDFDAECMYLTGYHFPVLALIILLLILTACANALLLVFAALSLGQLASLHKLRAAIGVGIALGLLEQIASTMVMIYLSETLISRTAGRYLDTSASFEQMRDLVQVSTQTMMWSMIGIFTIFAAIYYVICAFIVKKHINLE